MAKQVETPYMAYEFDADEAPLAMVFTDLQEKHIRTELAKAATEKMVLRVDPANPGSYMQECEYIRGKMEALSYLLAMSDAHKGELLVLVAARAEAAASEAKSETRQPE